MVFMDGFFVSAAFVGQIEETSRSIQELTRSDDNFVEIHIASPFQDRTRILIPSDPSAAKGINPSA